MLKVSALLKCSMFSGHKICSIFDDLIVVNTDFRIVFSCGFLKHILLKPFLAYSC